MPVGAPAPPEGLDSAADFSLSLAFSAEAPPEGVASSSLAPLELPPLAGSSVASLPPDELAALSLVVVLLVDVFDEVDVVCAAACSALVSFGGVMLGVLLGTESLALLPPPQAASVPPARSSASAEDDRADSQRSARPRSQRLHAPAAGGTVVEVLLRELVAPVAEAQVLHGPGQTRGRRGERQDLADDLQLVAAFAVAIDLAGLGLEHDLAPAGGVSQAVALTGAHAQDSIGASDRSAEKRALGEL